MLGLEPRDAGQMDSEEEAAVRESATALDSDKMEDASIDSSPPGPYVRVSLAVVGEGTIAALIISLLAIKSQAERERESVEPTQHSPAELFALATSLLGRANDEHCSALYDGPVWVEEGNDRATKLARRRPALM
eukprot:6194534-Pleurochrysis_carterae.AAC.1